MNQADAFDAIKGAVIDKIITPLVWLLFAAALVYFLYGVVKYLWSAASAEARETGRQHMLYGIIGMALMLSVFGIVKFIFNVVTDNGTAKDSRGNTIPKPSVVEKGNF